MLYRSSLGQTHSRFESLPVEIIQEIFLRSLEFNLPRASIHIARVLSSPLLYTWLIRLAFSSSNEGSKQRFFTPDFLPPPLDFFALSTEERSNLQTTILGCRWSTVSLIRKCQREYIEHAIRRRCQNLLFSPEDNHIIANIGSQFKDLDRYDKGQDGHRGKGDLVLKVKSKETNKTYRVAVWFNFGAFQISEPSTVYAEEELFRLPCCAATSPARMPDKLLHPPWTVTKLEFLSLLSMDAYIDEDDSHDRSRRVLRQAIRDRDFATFERLLNLRIRTKCYKYPIRWPVQPNIFHAALKYADQFDDPFVKLLVDQRWEEIPAKDIRLKNKLMAKMEMNSLGCR